MRASLILVVAAGLLPLVGCDDPVYEQQLRMRQEGMAEALHLLVEAERPREENLKHLWGLARQNYQEDVAAIREDPHIIGHEINGEFQRFHDHLPDYGGEIKRQLEGDPENIRRTLPYMIY